MLTKDEIQRTVAQVDRSTVMGKRDYAIILLSARNGLRGSDIINLKLTDVGEALKEHILNGRPDSHSEFIFLVNGR
ncbi:hypothetical protein C806_02696 [Lachnospiraceae bacterium 3-1]|nr:hypothetical protein C806_02696 [Lachnospiraceae bacterium 3-1]